MTETLKKATCYSFSLKNIQDADAMGYLRIVSPYTKAGYEIIPGLQNNEILFEPIETSDIIVIQRNFPVRYADYEKIINRARKHNKPVIFDLDDLFFHLPEHHPDRKNHTFASSLVPMFQAVMDADLVTVTSPILKKALIKFNPNIKVLPNYLDDNIWHFQEPVIGNKKTDEIVIGYMGTKSHQTDLLFILSVLDELLSIHGNGIKFRFWGVKPPEKFLSNPQVEWLPFFSMEYKKFAEFFQTQNADIFISPLIDNEFNKCKSPIKFFEYTSLGVPGVFSAIAPYSEVINHGETGLLAYSLEEWKNNLVDLIENPTLRYELAQNAQKYVGDTWLLSKNITKIEKILNEIYSSTKNDNQYSVVTRSINSQIYQYIESLEKNLFDNGQLIDQLRLEVEQLKNEIKGYYLSKSWQYTRPFRKISKNLFEKNDD
jgi:glycosyltransferase involved in cell wall biosynthesis